MLNSNLEKKIGESLDGRYKTLSSDSPISLPMTWCFSDSIDTKQGCFVSSARVSISSVGMIEVKTTITSCDKSLLDVYSIEELSGCVRDEYIYIARKLLFVTQCSKAAKSTLAGVDAVVYRTSFIKDVPNGKLYSFIYPALSLITKLNDFRVDAVFDEEGYVKNSVSMYDHLTQLDVEYIESEHDTVAKTTLNGYNLYIGIPELSLRNFEEIKC